MKLTSCLFCNSIKKCFGLGLTIDLKGLQLLSLNQNIRNNAVFIQKKKLVCEFLFRFLTKRRLRLRHLLHCQHDVAKTCIPIKKGSFFQLFDCLEIQNTLKCTLNSYIYSNTSIPIVDKSVSTYNSIHNLRISIEEQEQKTRR